MEKMRAYVIPKGALENQPDPIAELREQRAKEVRAILAQGIPVTLTCGGRRLCTLYPDGTTENHDEIF